MTQAVLDASAILAFLQNEPGEQVVGKALGEAVMSAVNASEVVAKLISRGMPAETAIDSVSILGVEIVPFGMDEAWDAARLTQAGKPLGLSFADRSCLALAQKLGARALTADRRWSALTDVVDVEVIR
jgi:PIN domain nuclease of toxin-antitoxin system